MIKKINNINIIPLLLITFILFSCRTTDTENKISGGAALININLQGSEFEDAGEVNTKASANKNMPLKKGVQQQEIPFSKDITLQASLNPVVSSMAKAAQASYDKNIVAAVENVQSGIKYRLVVYDANGNYVTQRLYTRGREANAPVLQLDGESTYSFVVYSFNTTADIPEVATNTTLNSNISFTGLNSTSDLMYYFTRFKVSGSETNYLNVVFKHKFSQVTVKLDASELNSGNIGNVTSGFAPHYTGATMRLSNGDIASRTSGASSAVVFPQGSPSPVKTADPTIINIADGEAMKYTINNITVGSESRSALILDQLTVRPGFRYALNLKFKKPSVCTVEVSLAGGIKKKFMCYNLGASVTASTADYNSNQVLAAHYGDKYQWGKKTPVLTEAQDQNTAYDRGTSFQLPAGTPAIPWPTDRAGITAWGASKTTADPCPAGFRVPTEAEWISVRGNNAENSLGTWSSSTTSFDSAKKFGDLLLPAGGSRSISGTNHPTTGVPISGPGRMNGGRNIGVYWSATSASTGGNSSNARTVNFGRATTSANSFITNIDTLTGASVRCIEN
ncbi:hypothetical protein [Elizabethkingia meningoseptica]|uniref:hypothetical protein n=1 Tax=Elizabethkingia meningoseptica TaxID=238 RepID=UPI002DD62A56|nr:hypothetical protein [Elizabethkingia meningoseptica]MEC4712969.1 hypothetical protein [Elizabethkingia meningoseptica]